MAIKTGYAVALIVVGLMQAQTIILDPGHGGVYTGTKGATKLVEKELTLAVAQKVAARLRKQQHKVVLTRQTDTELDKSDLLKDLALRAAYTTQYKRPIFVSIHFNGANYKDRRGFRIYVPYETKYPQRSYALAGCVHYELSHTLPVLFAGGKLGNLNVYDGGIRAAKFNVLVKAVCPAILVELEYLSNPEAEAALQTSSYQDQLAHALASGIRRYLGSA